MKYIPTCGEKPVEFQFFEIVLIYFYLEHAKFRVYVECVEQSISFGIRGRKS